MVSEDNAANGNAIIARFYGPDAEANARLDAAAPALLEALRLLVFAAQMEDAPTSGEIADAKAAIQSATGEG